MNKKYKIWIIDDEYSDMRKDTYEKFLKQEYSDVEISFEIKAIEYANELAYISSDTINEIDAFFIDVRLEDKSKGWGNSNVSERGFTFVLNCIERAYGKKRVPPIFMISKHWSDPTILSKVSKEFAMFTQNVSPVRFFSLADLQDCVTIAEQKDANGKINTAVLNEERKYIFKEIEKINEIKFADGDYIHAVLILAVTDEKEMAYKVFDITEESPYNGKYDLRYAVATLDKYKIAIITQDDMGMSKASTIATSALLAFKPLLVCMSGICAGMQTRVKLGDVIIPSSVIDYSRGKKTIDGFKYRPKTHMLNSTVSSYVKNKINRTLLSQIRTGFEWGELPDKDIQYIDKPMATGSWVVNEPSIFNEIEEHINSECVALDMEAFSIADAAERYDTEWLIIKSVQDYANGNKDSDEKNIRKFSAYSSAKLLKEILCDLLKDIQKKKHT